MNILYEDNHIIVAVKPPNIPTQADSSNDESFLSQVKNYVKAKYNKPGEVYIGLVHRLDRPTSGVMIFARTSKAAKRLSDQLKNGEFQKTYSAVVTNETRDTAILTDYLYKDTAKNISKVVQKNTKGAKKAVLSYKTLARKDDQMALLEISLETGRSHQIRVQLQNVGAPILGDKKYGGDEYPYLCLQATSLSFLHPTKKEQMAFSIPLPRFFPAF